MALSPTYSWPEPDDTDLVMNGALAMRDLGDAIDSTVDTIDTTTLKTNADGTTSGSLTATRFVPTGSTIPTNGIYLPAANTVGIATNSVQRMTINSAGLIAGAGTSLGAWTSYTPTYNNVTVGNGTTTARYVQIGKIVHFFVQFTLGSTSAVTGRIEVTLPVTATAGNVAMLTNMVDSSPFAAYSGIGYYNSTTNMQLMVTGTNGLLAATSATNPFTWASGDTFRIVGTYEA